MHIPDGYISPQTSLAAIGLMLPVWSLAINKVKKVFSVRQVPFLALCSAFSFVAMMFNIPLGVSSVHAVGAVFTAILLGPWAACISVSIALAIQALFFGDGGVFALAANCLNIAFVMPFSGYYTYKIISGNSKILSKRGVCGIFAGGYVGLNFAALFTAFELGIQPILFKSIDGIPKYGFYSLDVSIPAVMLEHLLAAGPIEGIITVSAITYLAKFSPALFDKKIMNNSELDTKPTLTIYKAFALGLLGMVLATPLGLIATGTAWGEWGSDEIQGMIGFIPEGIKCFSEFWKALIPDYTVPGMTDTGFEMSLGYIISAVIGILLIILFTFISSKFIVKKEK